MSVPSSFDIPSVTRSSSLLMKAWSSSVNATSFCFAKNSSQNFVDFCSSAFFKYIITVKVIFVLSLVRSRIRNPFVKYSIEVKFVISQKLSCISAKLNNIVFSFLSMKLRKYKEIVGIATVLTPINEKK